MPAPALYVNRMSSVGDSAERYRAKIIQICCDPSHFELTLDDMKILFLCTKYPDTLNESYLTSELADAFSALGHEVTVICLQWSSKDRLAVSQLNFPSGVVAHFSKPKNYSRLGLLFERLSRWGLSSFFLGNKAIDTLQQQRFDLVIAFAPLVPLAGLINKFLSTADHSYAYVTDFFPIAARDIGLVPKGGIYRFAKWLENRLLFKFGAIGCMSAANEKFLKNYYKLPGSARVHVNPLWGTGKFTAVSSRSDIRERYGLPTDKDIILFGGQLIEGRGLEEIIGASALFEGLQSDPLILVVGDGRMRHTIEHAVSMFSANLRLLKPMPRPEYLELATACDAGLVVTVADTVVPTFPSKTIDYVRTGLPVLASVEEGTDFGQIVSDQGFGRAIIAGDSKRLHQAILDIFEDRSALRKMREASERSAVEFFSVSRACQEIINHTGLKNFNSIDQ